MRKKKYKYIFKSFLCLWFWQDIEKSNIFIRIMNWGIVLFLSFCIFCWCFAETNIHICFRVIISLYGIFSLMSYWPASYLLDEKNKIGGFAFSVSQNISVLFSVFILFKYILSKYKEENL
ncbi:hypothetical protein UT300002_32610 [Clostridium perfringens]